MISRIEIENFMSLRSVGVDLEPVTVFVGFNASGKSAIFKALVTLSKLLSGTAVRGKEGDFRLEEGVLLDDLVWSGNSGLPIKFRVWLEGSTDRDNPTYTLELTKRAEGWSVIREGMEAGDHWIEVDERLPFVHPTERHGDRPCTPPMRGTLRFLVHPFFNDSVARPSIEPIIQMAKRIGETWRYRPSASDIAQFVKAPSKRGRGFLVRPNGWGVALALQELQGAKRETFTEIEEELRRLFPHIRTIGFKSDWQGVRLQFMTDRSEDPITAPQESDGVLLATFLLWRLYTAGPSVCVCLEEPESGLHPHLLGDRFETLKKFSYPGDTNRPPVQILVATHSRDLLRIIKSHHSTLYNELRIVDFDPQSGTSVRPLSHYREAGQLLEKYGWLP